MNTISVLISSGSRLLRDGIACCLASCPEIELVGAAESLDDLLAEDFQTTPHVLLLDLSSCTGQVDEQLTRLQTEQPDVQLIVLDYAQEEASIMLALSIGARGYVCGQEGAQELIAAIRTVEAGNAYLCPGACGVLVREFRRKTETFCGG